MSDVSRWRDSGHLERAVQTAGGQEAFDSAVAAMLDDARGWRLAEMRKRRGMTQEQVATRMGISVARISQIESGDVSTQDVLNRFITALGGTLKLIADFGDEQLKIALPGHFLQSGVRLPRDRLRIHSRTGTLHHDERPEA
jgi:transcriptional regulator with XRE-family HTH domain